MQDESEQLENWATMWDQAQSKGLFQDAPKPPAISEKHSYDSFFGPQETSQKDAPDDFESKYWASVYNTSMGAPPDPEPEVTIPDDDSGNVAMIHDSVKKHKHVIKENAAAVGTRAKAMAQSANPIRATSVGMDQDMSPESLGLTFTPKDLESLADLKLRLHTLQDKLNTFEGKGQSGNRFESQIKSLLTQINELSDSLSQAFPDEIMHQGD